MTDIEIKNAIMSLWKDTFHDSDEYISLIFDVYYHSDMVEYEIVDGEIISALMGIPYSFVPGNKCVVDEDVLLQTGVDNDVVIRGLYLCGLCTNNNYRAKGIMSKLIEKINFKAYKLGYVFTFLIPADRGLELYYKDRGYVNCNYKIYNNFVAGYNFVSSDIMGCRFTMIDKLGDVCNNSNYVSIIRDYVNKRALIDGAICLCRHKRDVETILHENIISNGYCVICYDKIDNICGILFSHGISNNVIKVQQVYADSKNIKFELLQYLQNKIGDNVSITLCEDVICAHQVAVDEKIFMPYRESFSPTLPMSGVIAQHREVMTREMLAKPFAMGRILKLAEVLIFATRWSPGRKYSILVTEDVFEENCGLYHVDDKDVTFIPISEISGDELERFKRRSNEESSFYHLTVGEFASLLWRNNSDSVLEEIIDIPKLPVNISLMLE